MNEWGPAGGKSKGITIRLFLALSACVLFVALPACSKRSPAELPHGAVSIGAILTVTPTAIDVWGTGSIVITLTQKLTRGNVTCTITALSNVAGASIGWAASDPYTSSATVRLREGTSSRTIPFQADGTSATYSLIAQCSGGQLATASLVVGNADPPSAQVDTGISGAGDAAQDTPPADADRDQESWLDQSNEL